MFPSLKIRYIILFLSSIIIVHGLVYESKWINRLLKNIKKDLRISQSVFIIDDNFDNQTKKIDDVIKKVKSTVPSQVISVKEATLSRVRTLEQNKLYHDLHATTLFIALLHPDNNLQNKSIADTAKFLTELSTHQIRPKCLLIIFPQKEGLRYKEFLRNMWSKNFLDLTILEVTEKESGDNFSLWSRRGDIAMVHCLNPFSGIYTKKNYRAKTKLFPNKLRDLSGTELKVGSFTYFPYTKVKRNSSGYPTSVSGPEALVAKALSKAMNFKISEVPSKQEWWGRWHCPNASASTGFAGMLRDNKIRFLTNQGVIMSNCTSQFSRSTGPVRYTAFILKVKENKRSFLISVKWLYLVLVIVPIWFIPRLLAFNIYYWSLIHIIQAMLGFTVPREPQRSAERIMFGIVLIAFFVFSSTLFSVLTDIKITEEKEIVISTLEGLSKSNLIPVMPNAIYNVLREGSEDVTEALLNKSRVGVQHEKCIEMLLKHEKVACVDREEIAEMILSRYLDANGHPVMTIIKETFGHYKKCMVLEKNSPLVGAIDKILIKLQESGLNSHWYKPLSSRLLEAEESEIKEQMKSVKLIVPLLVTLAIGYGVAFVVFIIELLKKHI